MGKILDVINDLIKEQESIQASEKLGGNIVKEEFHKGALFILRYLNLKIKECTSEIRNSQNDQPTGDKSKPADITPHCETCLFTKTCNVGIMSAACNYQPRSA